MGVPGDAPRGFEVAVVQKQVVLQDLAVRHAGAQGCGELRPPVQLREGRQDVLRVGVGHQQTWTVDVVRFYPYPSQIVFLEEQPPIKPSHVHS